MRFRPNGRSPRRGLTLWRGDFPFLGVAERKVLGDHPRPIPRTTTGAKIAPVRPSASARPRKICAKGALESVGVSAGFELPSDVMCGPELAVPLGTEPESFPSDPVMGPVTLVPSSGEVDAPVYIAIAVAAAFACASRSPVSGR